MLKSFSIIFLLFFLTSCKKENETVKYLHPEDYFPLEEGRYITYRLDSTVFLNFGKEIAVKSYQVKDLIEAKIADEPGRKSFRIIRYSRKDAGDSWVASNTFMVTSTGKRLEYTENNLRYIKLSAPVKTGNSWRGNSYIDTYNSANDLRYLDNWDYIYDSVSAPLSIATLNFENTIKVFHRDEIINDPTIPGSTYAEKTYSVEKYAIGVGLIFKEFLHWEYQGNTRSYTGYGIKLSIIDYN